jgi:RNA polymerase sigma-70 factor (ECF subfamily)
MALSNPPAWGDATGTIVWDWARARALCRVEVRRVLGSRPEVEDAVQEALLRAWKGRSTCRDPASPVPWLLAIARNEALRAGRRLAQRSEVESEEAWEPIQEFAGERVVERLDLRAALENLPPQDRLLLELRYSQDVTQPRAAEVLGLPEGTVKVRLHRLRKRLRSMLEADGSLE